jgi:Spx/MgsR family transcriptional regulator
MTGTVTLYGIANCDTIKKARDWLRDHGIDFVFHDYRKQGVNPQQLQSMAAELGWEGMLNRRGSTWRTLPENVRASIDQTSALGVMLDNPAIIKRPILEVDERLYIGFDAQQYQEIFS